MHRLFALPPSFAGASSTARRGYAAAWLVVLLAMLAGPVAASLQPAHAEAWLLAAAIVAAAGLGTAAVILHRTASSAEAHGSAGEASSGAPTRPVLHDLNNQLTIVAGFTDALLSRLEPGDANRGDLEAVQAAAEKAIRILQRARDETRGTGKANQPERTASAPQPQATHPEPPSGAGPLSVLIVDDEPSIRTLIRRALAGIGCNILEAGSGEDALAEAATYDGKIDIAIVDFVLPDLNGMDLALQLERNCPALKTLYVSSAAESIGMASMLRHAPERVLLKPFTAEEIVKRVRALAGSRG
jgi:CheY-like chemotaxis protein